jgi:FLVCR family MFS transporter
MLYEVACELAYPTSEGAANGLLTYFNNFWGLIFLAVFTFPNVGKLVKCIFILELVFK